MAKSKLLSQVRTQIKRRNYSYHTEQAYVGWITRFVKFYKLRHPSEMAEDEVVAYLNYLAKNRNVAASTQNQALCAILFLYNNVLESPLSSMMDFQRAKESQMLPVVLSRAEVKEVLSHLQGTSKLVAQLLYGSGLRISECLRLRVLDLDFSYHQIQVRSGKGRKDRITVMPQICKQTLRQQVQKGEKIVQLISNGAHVLNKGCKGIKSPVDML